MAIIKSFESREQKIDKENVILREDNEKQFFELDAQMARFKMKGENGATITAEDVKALFRPACQLHENNKQIANNLSTKGVDAVHADFSRMATEAFWEEKTNN